MPQRDQKSAGWMFDGRMVAASDQVTDQLPAIQTGRANRTNQGRGMKLVIWLMFLTAIAIVLVIGAMLASEVIVKPIVADRAEEDLSTGVQTFVNQEIASLPAPNGTSQQYFVSEGELNQRLSEERDLGLINNARAEINQDGIVVHLNAYRMSGTYHAQVIASNGAVRLENGSLSGPLSFVIPVDEFERTANDAILSSLSTSKLHVTDVTLVDGEIVLTLESTGAGYGISSGQ